MSYFEQEAASSGATTQAIFQEVQAKTEHLHKWEMKTKLMLEEKEREVHEGKRVLAHTEEQLNRKTAEIARLKENYKQSLIENQDLKRNKAHQERLATCLEMDIKNLQSIFNHQKEAIDVLEQGQRQTETKNVELNSAFAKLKIAKEEETEELAEKIRQKDAQITSMQEDNDRKERQLNDVLKNLSEKCAEKVKELETLKSQIEEKDQLIHSSSARLAETEEKMTEMMEEADMMTAKLEEKEMLLNTQIGQLQALENELKSAQEKYAQSELQLTNDLNISKVDSSNKSQELDQLRAEIQSMAETIQLITSSEQSTRLTIAQKETEILNLNQAAEEKEKIIKSQLEHFKILEQQMNSEHFEIAQITEQLQSKVRFLKNESSEKSRELDLLKGETEKKEKVIDELTVEAKSAQDTVKQIEQELVQLKATLNETKSTVEGQREELNTANALTSKLEAAYQLVELLEEEKADREGQLEALSRTKDELLSERATMSKECESLGQRNEELQHRVRVNQDCISEMIHKFEALQSKLADAEELIQSLHNQVATNKNQVLELDTKLQAAEVEKRTLLSEFSQTKDGLLADLHSQQKEMNALKEANLNLQKELAKQAKNHQESQNDLLARIDFLKESLVQAEERVRSLNAEVAEASINKEKLGQLEAQLLAVETKKAKTIADLAEENDRKIAMLAGDLEREKKFRTEAESYITKQDTEIQQLKTELKQIQSGTTSSGSKLPAGRKAPPAAKTSKLMTPAVSASSAAKVPLGKAPVKDIASSSEDDIFALPKKDTPEARKAYESKRKSSGGFGSQTTPTGRIPVSTPPPNKITVKTPTATSTPGNGMAIGASGSASKAKPEKRILVDDKSRRSGPSRLTPRGRRFSDNSD